MTSARLLKHAAAPAVAPTAPCPPSKHARLDHRVEYGEGGDTCTDNLITVCQHHHNVNTDRRCDYILDPATGTDYWLFVDGTWESTERNLVPLPEPEEISFDD